MTDRNQLIAALMAAVTALFVASGLPPVVRWRQTLRRGAVIAYAAAVAVAVGGVFLWLLGRNG